MVRNRENNFRAMKSSFNELLWFSAGHIRKIDGFYGCYRGLTPKLVGSICSMVLSEKIADRLGLKPLEEPKDDVNLSDEELQVIFKSDFICEF